ncbi:unnamed protein product [Auanema sp. JU1783]|nr:unnamed protein product [Auanema sp. JU1783]
MFSDSFQDVRLFTQELANFLASRYIELWDTEEPKSNERERIIRIKVNGSTDQLIISSAEGVGLDADELISFLPDNTLLYVNPGEVYYKCSERANPCVIWIGPVNSDEDYRTLPCSALQGLDKENGMGVSGKSAVGSRALYSDGVTVVEDPYIPLHLENMHPAAIDSPLKQQAAIKQFVFVPKDHKSYLVEDFAITRFGSHRNRPDHDVMRRIQLQAAMKSNGSMPSSMPCVSNGLEDYGSRNQLSNEMELNHNDILQRMTQQQREWLLKRLLEFNYQESGMMPNSNTNNINNNNNINMVMRNSNSVSSAGDGFSSLLASMPNLLTSGTSAMNNTRSNGMGDINNYSQFGNFNDGRSMSNECKRNWGHGDWE